MGMNLAYKILNSKLKEGKLIPGEQIGIQIDQTLTQDSTGTMAYLHVKMFSLWTSGGFSTNCSKGTKKISSTSS